MDIDKSNESWIFLHSLDSSLAAHIPEKPTTNASIERYSKFTSPETSEIDPEKQHIPGTLLDPPQCRCPNAHSPQCS